MSCSIKKVLDDDTNKKLDAGVDALAAKISAAVNSAGVDNENCRASDIDRVVNIANMVIQYVILSFVLIAIYENDNNAKIVNIIKFVGIVSLILIAVQYRNVLVSAVKLFLFGLDLEDQVVIIFSIGITLITGMLKKGTAGMKLTVLVAFLLLVRLVLQMKNFLTDSNSRVPAFLVFVKKLLTPDRIKKIYKAF
jgi:hypothetical protein